MLKYLKSYYTHFSGWITTIIIIVFFITLSGKNDFKPELLLFAPVIYVLAFLAYVREQKQAEKDNDKSSGKPDDEKQD
ncbi:MAG: hypothetical protein MJ145_04275 [Clostridia bacterium]|nr:hypothetical protein [Clostridia bacterium]